MGSRFNKFKQVIAKFTKRDGIAKVETPNDDEIMLSHLSDDARILLEELYSELGARPAATKESRRAARRIATILEQYTDDVTITSARIYTSVFKALIISLLCVSPIISIATIFNIPILALSISTIWLVSLIMQLKKKKNIFKAIMPSDEAANVHGILEPDDIVEETIVFTAHHDTAPENKAQKTFSLRYFTLYYLPALGFLILILTIISEFFYDIFRSSFVPSMALVPFICFSVVGLLLTYAPVACIKTIGKDYVSGAGDNLSGVSVVVEILRYFSALKKRGNGLKHTRLVFASFDGEECGAQGSYAWFKDNSKILCNARVVNFDGLYKCDDLVFLTQDGNGLVPLSAALASKCAEIAHLMGYKIDTGKLGIMAGETDAMSAAKNGYKATTLTSMRPEVKTPAHTSDDTPDKVEKDALAASILIGIKLAELEDSKWLKDKNDESVQFLDQNKRYKLTK